MTWELSLSSPRDSERRKEEGEQVWWGNVLQREVVEQMDTACWISMKL